MKLRDHSSMCYRGVPNWPPAWIGRDAKQSHQPDSEIGILTNVIQSKMKPANRLYLTIEHEGDEYLGALLFDDQFACRRIYKLLLRHRGELIHTIGEIDVPESAATATGRRVCKVCGSPQNFDFVVLDDVWRAAVPVGYRDETLCLKCFEVFTSEKQIELLKRAFPGRTKATS
jgi:hypothetical protein